MSSFRGLDKPLKVAYYIRVSTEDQVEKFGAELQLHSLSMMIASKGKLNDGITNAFEFAGERYIYRDDGISGTQPLLQRPGFSRLIEDLERAPEGQKPFDVIAVYKIDRFARRLKILMDAIDQMDKHNIKFMSVHESIDTSTPFGKAILGIVGVLAELELETIMGRTQDGREQASKSGVVMGLSAPYGYDKDENKKLIVIEDEAKVIRKIYDLFIRDGSPLASICRNLQEHLIESPSESAIIHGKRKGNASTKKSAKYFWDVPSIKKILTDEIYIGTHYYNKTKNKKPLKKSEWKKSEYNHEPIIDKFTFAKAQELINKRRQYASAKKTNNGHIYLLSGLLKCATCQTEVDKTMQAWHGEPKEVGKGTRKYSYYYKCRRKNSARTSLQCHALPLPADQIEEYIVARVAELLKDPEAVFEYQQQLKSTELEKSKLEKEAEWIRNKLHSLPKRRENVLLQHQHNHIDTKILDASMDEFKLLENKYLEQLKEIDIQLSENALNKRYIDTFELFNDKYQKIMKDVKKNRADIQRILNMLISEIIIHTRPINESDKIAGKKTPNQMIPNKIVIKFKLPEQYIRKLTEDSNIGVIETGEYFPLTHPDEIEPSFYVQHNIDPIEYRKQWEKLNDQFGDKYVKW